MAGYFMSTQILATCCCSFSLPQAGQAGTSEDRTRSLEIGVAALAGVGVKRHQILAFVINATEKTALRGLKPLSKQLLRRSARAAQPRGEGQDGGRRREAQPRRRQTSASSRRMDEADERGEPLRRAALAQRQEQCLVADIIASVDREGGVKSARPQRRRDQAAGEA